LVFSFAVLRHDQAVVRVGNSNRPVRHKTARPGRVSVDLLFEFGRSWSVAPRAIGAVTDGDFVAGLERLPGIAAGRDEVACRLALRSALR
jgi:hypothetical protein